MLVAPLKVDCARMHANTCVFVGHTNIACMLRSMCKTKQAQQSVCVRVCLWCFSKFLVLYSNERRNESRIFGRTHASQPSLKANGKCGEKYQKINYHLPIESGGACNTCNI